MLQFNFIRRDTTNILLGKIKRHRFQIGSKRIQFNVHIEQRQWSKKKFAIAQCKSILKETLPWWPSRGGVSEVRPWPWRSSRARSCSCLVCAGTRCTHRWVEHRLLACATRHENSIQQCSNEIGIKVCLYVTCPLLPTVTSVRYCYRP